MKQDLAWKLILGSWLAALLVSDKYHFIDIWAAVASGVLAIGGVILFLNAFLEGDLR